ncbi:MAG: 1-acyl-sn-glycerol-3-phosphate acyltransferase, partial [Lysobacterales bacterium]
MLARPGLRERLREIARETGASEKKVEEEAAACLRELVPGSSRLGYRLLIAFSRFVYRRGYDREIACDPVEIERYRELARNHPVALVGNHRSQVDGFAMYCAMHDNGLPHPFTFGGINMKLPLMGAILKGSKLIFIRRSFGDNPVYKAVLRAYIDFLVENRFPLFWAIEGTRSRTGKLSAPRFGLISWVVDAQQRVASEDLYVVPVAVSYEQIRDAQSYSDEQRGVKKKPENFRWLVKYLAGFKHNLGQITVRFGEGVSLQQQMEQIRRTTPEILDFRDKVVLKMAIAGCLGLNKVTPITATSLVCMLLLQAAPHAVTRDELTREFAGLAAYVRSSRWPATFDVTFDNRGDSGPVLERTLASLEANDVVECYAEGADPVYSIKPGKD